MWFKKKKTNESKPTGVVFDGKPIYTSPGPQSPDRARRNENRIAVCKAKLASIKETGSAEYKSFEAELKKRILLKELQEVS